MQNSIPHFLATSRTRSTLALASLALLSCLPVSAQTAVWNGSTATYSTAADWSTGSVPSATTAVSISSGTVTYSDTNTGSSDYLTRTAATTISGTGKLVITNNRFENANTGNATVTISGSGNLTQSNGQYFIVAHAGAGTINQSGGTVSSTVSTGWGLSDNSGSVGTYNLTGGTLNVTDTGGGGSSYGVSIGRNSGSDVFDVNGGTANFGTAGTADVRAYISNGATLRVDSGTATFNQFNYLTVGRSSSTTTTSKVLVDGGTLSFTNMFNNGGTGGGISVGNGGAGIITVSSGTLNMNQGAGVTDFIDVGDGANGTITQTGGIINTNMEFILSNKTGNSGTYNMSGGTLNALNIAEGDGNLATFDFTGGQIFLDGDQTSLINDSWFTGANGTTATFDSASDTTEIFIAAAPEPVSGYLALLALAGFVLYRRSFKRVS